MNKIKKLVAMAAASMLLCGFVCQELRPVTA